MVSLTFLTESYFGGGIHTRIHDNIRIAFTLVLETKQQALVYMTKTKYVQLPDPLILSANDTRPTAARLYFV